MIHEDELPDVAGIMYRLNNKLNEQNIQSHPMWIALNVYQRFLAMRGVGDHRVYGRATDELSRNFKITWVMLVKAGADEHWERFDKEEYTLDKAIEKRTEFRKEDLRNNYQIFPTILYNFLYKDYD